MPAAVFAIEHWRTPPPPAPRRDPRDLFCRDWAAGACSKEVVANCQAPDVEACRTSQAKFCRTLVRDGFSDRDGRACTDAVALAYADAQLRGPELSLVRELGAPCDRVRVGSHKRGQPCTESNDCDRSAGYDCVRKANPESGTCQIPQQAWAGRDCRAADLACEPGFFCDGQHCIEAVGPGEPCTIHEQCGETGYCNARKCAERKGVTEPCLKDVECSAGICSQLFDKRTCTDRIVLSRAEPICDDLK